MKKIKVAVAMSGGVDSAVAAVLLVEQGYQCTGFHLHFWSEFSKDKVFENKCCSTESLQIARKTANLLKIPFYHLDFAKIFKKKVVDYFLKSYQKGLTPNPCIVCNKTIKFGEFFKHIRKLGFDFLATGHYARIEDNRLLKGKDKIKDQSYFLYRLEQIQLPYLLFPVGNYYKKEVLKLAEKWKLPSVYLRESQEICFLPEKDYRYFLKRQLKEKIIPGKVINIKGQAIGTHYGLPLYTIGQRHGFSLNLKTKTPLLPPYYVIKKDFKKNLLIVGFGQETEKKEFQMGVLNWLVSDYKRKLKERNLKVRVRHQGDFLDFIFKDRKVVLKEPEMWIAPGQSAVFYLGEEVLGGGFITD